MFRVRNVEMTALSPEKTLTVNIFGYDEMDIMKELECFSVDNNMVVIPPNLKLRTLHITSDRESFFALDRSTNIQFDYKDTFTEALNPERYDRQKINESIFARIGRILIVNGESGTGKTSWCQKAALVYLGNLFDFKEKASNIPETIKFMKSISRDLEFVVQSAPVILDHIDWILNPEGLENMIENERWALLQFRETFVDFILHMDRLIVISISSNLNLSSCAPRIQSLVVDTITMQKTDEENYDSSSAENNYIGWDTLKGMDKAKAALEESILWPIKHSRVYQANNFPQSAGVLLHGPTGTGKTALMNSLLTSLPNHVHVIKVSGPELLSKYIGASEEAVRKVFAEARKHKPTVIAFDEIDSLAPRRGNDNTGVTDRVVNQLLTEIDGTESKDNIFIVATSSRKDQIDPALIRSGRIDQHIQLDYPTEGERSEIICSMLSGDISELLFEKLIIKTEGMSPAAMRGLLYEAQLNGLEGGAELTDADSLVLSALSIETNIGKSLNNHDANQAKMRATFA